MLLTGFSQYKCVHYQNKNTLKSLPLGFYFAIIQHPDFI